MKGDGGRSRAKDIAGGRLKPSPAIASDRLSRRNRGGKGQQYTAVDAESRDAPKSENRFRIKGGSRARYRKVEAGDEDRDKTGYAEDEGL